MRSFSWTLLGGLCACLLAGGHADGRGFGGGASFGGARSFGGGGFGGYRSESFGGERSEFGGARSFDSSRSVGGYNDFSGRSFDASSSRSVSAGESFRGGYAGGSYDRSYTGSRGGSVNVDGERGVAEGPRGGVAAGGSRDVSATGPDGRSYSSSREGGVAAGPYGRTIGGASGDRSVSGPRGTASSDWQSGFAGWHGAGGHMSTDFGLSHYSSFNTAAIGHTTTYWSHSTMTTHAGYVRTNFGYYNCFHPGWYTAHPGAWFAAGWAADAAWTAASYATLASFCALPAQPMSYDYGNTVIYQDNSVYVNGQDVGTAQTYNQQATALADQGQKAAAPPTDDWKAIGVYALVQGDEKTSNNIFQMAINKDGIIRGNYYDGLLDTTTPIYGSLDRKTQRVAWTIGQKKDRVFDAGIANLTQPEAPVLVHIGTDRTQQMLLVRVEQPPKGSN